MKQNNEDGGNGMDSDRDDLSCKDCDAFIRLGKVGVNHGSRGNACSRTLWLGELHNRLDLK